MPARRFKKTARRAAKVAFVGLQHVARSAPVRAAAREVKHAAVAKAKQRIGQGTQRAVSFIESV